MGVNKSIKIKKSMLVLTCVFLVYFCPAYFLTFTNIRNMYYAIAGAISVVFIFFVLLDKIKKEKRQGYLMVLLIFLFYGIILLTTYINGGPYRAYLVQSVIGVGFCAMVIYLFGRKLHNEALAAIIIVLEILVIANLFTILIYPDGLYLVYGYTVNSAFGRHQPGFLLGHRNNAIEYCIPLIGLICYKDLLDHKKHSLNYIFAIMISIISSILTWSANAIVCIAFIILAEVFMVVKKESKILNVGSLYISSAILSALIILADIQEFFSFFLEKILHRDVTLSNRTKIWSRALVAISEKPLLGYGIEEGSLKFLRISHSNSCHNYFLDYLYYGGIVLLCVITLIIVLISKRIKYVEKYLKVKMSIFFGAYFLLWLATPIHMNYLFIMFGFMTVTICMPWEEIYQQKGL